MIKVIHLDFWEHFVDINDNDTFKFLDWSKVNNRSFQTSKERFCYRKKVKGDSYTLATDYFVGVDWLIKGQVSLSVAPKVNISFVPNFQEEAIVDTKFMAKFPVIQKELNYLKMLSICMELPDVSKELANLLFIDWTVPEISITQDRDHLSPMLIVQFIHLLKRIVKKGLKKSYYKIEENLSSKVKGKILIGSNLRQNILKNRLTNTKCSFQEYGIDSEENRFLKKVLSFCLNYIDHNKTVFGDLFPVLKLNSSFCRPYFNNISDMPGDRTLEDLKQNVFYREYKDAIRLGGVILKRFGYNITCTTGTYIKTPPFWIDMPRLFELYVYAKLLKVFPKKGEVLFQFSTYGNSLDFLINSEFVKMIIDAKYKLAYTDSHVHQDIRQVSGYARLKKVYDELKISDDRLLDCLIIHPDFSSKDELSWVDIKEVKPYKRIYKLGIALPLYAIKKSIN